MKVRFNRVPLYLTLALVPFAVVGCGESKEDLSVKPSPQPVASAPFPSPSVPATLNSPSKVALTRPTNPDERLRVIKSGRSDPFNSLVPSSKGILSTIPSQSSSTPAQSSSTQFLLKQASLGGSSQESTNIGNNFNNSGQCGTSEGATASQAKLVSLPTLPARIPPNEARGTFVSGIAKIGSTSYAIVKAPSENQTRYVPEGGTLADGTVRVKAINAYNVESVVLEQNGETISRRVGAPSLEPETIIPEVKGGTIISSTLGTPGASGAIKGLLLKQIRLLDPQKAEPLVKAIVCNDQRQTIKVSGITLQIEDKKGAVLNTLPVQFPAPYYLKPGQIGELDKRLEKTELGLRGRSTEEITIKLVDWS